MRILALATEAYGGLGGIAQANRDLFDALSEMHQIIILPRKSNDGIYPLAQQGMQKLPRCGRLNYALGALINLRREGPFDLIFCGHIFMAPLAFVLSKMSQIPFWVHTHGIEVWDKPNPWVRYSAEQARLVTCVSRYTRRKFLGWANRAPQRVRILPDTYSPRFAPGPKPKSLICRYGLQSKKILLTVGRLSSKEKYKGHDKVISILPRVVEKFPGIAYVIAGDGDDRGRLEALADKNGVRDKVLFIGQVRDEELPDIYRMADLFVMPSTGEGFGIVFLEATACGVPVVGLDAGGTPDALQDGFLGTLVRDDELLNEIKRLLLNARTAGRPLSEMTIRLFGKANFRMHAKGLVANLVNLP